MNVDAAGGGLVMSSQPLAAGWRVKIDGRASPVKPGTFISFDVPAGHHNVEVVYSPAAFYDSLLGTFLGLLIVLGIGSGRRSLSGVLKAESRPFETE
jgi:uncharacterized membrane protein YfhO